MPNANSGNQASPLVRQPNTSWGTRFIGYVKGKLKEKEAKRKNENPTDRAARRTADATYWIAAFTIILAITSGVTLYEVIAGGEDSHKLAESTLAASRAWVVVQGTGFTFTQDKSFPTGRVVLEDSGPSPAFRVDGWRCVQVRGDEPPLQEGRLQKSDTAICLSFFGGTLGRGVPITMDAYIPAQVPENFSKDTEGRGPHFYYWGVVTYDIYPSDGKRHYASFCLKNGGNQLSACREGGYQAD
jgi:hypothetical protein